jgi:hypothetical protein
MKTDPHKPKAVPAPHRVTFEEVRSGIGGNAEKVFFTMGREDRQWAFMMQLERDCVGQAIGAILVALLAIYL